MKIQDKEVGIIGLMSVLILIIALLVFGYSNAEFSFIDDFISKLGAKGEPNALWFNLIGFVTVGILLFSFGMTYGKLLNDKILSILLSLFGLGFAFTAVPIDMKMSNSPISKVHVVAICLGLAFWLFGLSRLGYNRQLKTKIRLRKCNCCVTCSINDWVCIWVLVYANNSSFSIRNCFWLDSIDLYKIDLQ